MTFRSGQTHHAPLLPGLVCEVPHDAGTLAVVGRQVEQFRLARRPPQASLQAALAEGCHVGPEAVQYLRIRLEARDVAAHFGVVPRCFLTSMRTNVDHTCNAVIEGWGRVSVLHET